MIAIVAAHTDRLRTRESCDTLELMAQLDEARVRALVEAIRALNRDARISARGQRMAAEAWGWAYYFIGVPATATAAAAGLSVITDLNKWLAAGLALGSALLTGLMTFLRPGDESLNHRNAAASYNVLQQRLKTLYTVDVPGGLEYDELRQRFEELQAVWDDLERKGPHVRERTYRRAQRHVDQQLRGIAG
jgi:hypothetical protein